MDREDMEKLSDMVADKVMNRIEAKQKEIAKDMLDIYLSTPFPKTLGERKNIFEPNDK